ncbi:tannase/feruloyl esterase family alpha/beta hydrolase, partial [Nocardioides sp. NPDC000441]
TGAEVTATRSMPASGTGPTALPAYCRADIAIHPVDPAAPDIRMGLALPQGWNGKTMMFGGGGYNGTVPNLAQNVPFGPVDQRTPLGRGYATYASDSGHQADTSRHPIASLDGWFGQNDEAVRNFSGDALKKVHDTATYVISKAFGRAPGTAYFAGGSTGGREALAVAQRWPRDFDGVISAYPAWNAATLDLFFGRITHEFGKPGAFPSKAQQDLVAQRVLAACDGGDGVTDGVISDEAGCDFDPETLLCGEGETPGDTCLSREQVDAVVAADSSWRLPYRVASGEWGYPGFPLLSGARMSTPVLGFGTAAPADPMPVTAGYGMQFWNQWAKYFVARDPQISPFAIDPADPGEWQGRISELTALQDVNDADLRPFARSGGRLILVHGAADELVSHRSTIDYYQRVQRLMGKRATEGFSRFYLVPGANHANFAPVAFSASYDSLTALEKWAERGVAPGQNQVVADGNAGAARTRPLCDWPAWPAYVGGPASEASSFRCEM